MIKDDKSLEEYQLNKDIFFEKYNKYKKGEISGKDLTSKEIFIANQLLKKEYEINKNASIRETRKLNELNEKISIMEKSKKLNS